MRGKIFKILNLLFMLFLFVYSPIISHAAEMKTSARIVFKDPMLTPHNSYQSEKINIVAVAPANTDSNYEDKYPKTNAINEWYLSILGVELITIFFLLLKKRRRDNENA